MCLNVPGVYQVLVQTLRSQPLPWAEKWLLQHVYVLVPGTRDHGPLHDEKEGVIAMGFGSGSCDGEIILDLEGT